MTFDRQDIDRLLADNERQRLAIVALNTDRDRFRSEMVDIVRRLELAARKVPALRADCDAALESLAAVIAGKAVTA